MGDYAECHKTHSHYGMKPDGCQEFKASRNDMFSCEICGCHRNFHRKVVYTKCQKNHDYTCQNSVDGCQEFSPAAKWGEGELICATCGCKKGFHLRQ